MLHVSLILMIFINYKIAIFTFFFNYDSASAMQAYNLSRRPDNICCAYLQVGNTVVQTRVIQPLVHRTLVHLMYFFLEYTGEHLTECIFFTNTQESLVICFFALVIF